MPKTLVCCPYWPFVALGPLKPTAANSRNESPPGGCPDGRCVLVYPRRPATTWSTTLRDGSNIARASLFVKVLSFWPDYRPVFAGCRCALCTTFRRGSRLLEGKAGEGLRAGVACWGWATARGGLWTLSREMGYARTPPGCVSIGDVHTNIVGGRGGAFSDVVSLVPIVLRADNTTTSCLHAHVFRHSHSDDENPILSAILREASVVVQAEWDAGGQAQRFHWAR